MKDLIRRILSETVQLHEPIDTLRDDADLYAAGLESIATVHLMLAIEENFDVEIPDHLLTRQLFSSIDAMAAVIAGLQEQKVAL